ncbi:MAG: ABC transporter substrate-binding protein [Planctomycetes bacterium]|nr:ABC transporter substrate-binding protein [Planctomycetota bacterium]
MPGMFGSCLALALAAAAAPPPYDDFRGMDIDFEGPGRNALAPPPADGLRIGLMAPERTADGKALRLGAELAIEERNAAGGCGGAPFVPIFRADDGPWGMATKQVVALAYDDEVLAIVGGIDGTRAHLAELVAAKAWIPVITPSASDYTIDYANVPWVFRTPPSDDAQARLLIACALDRGLRRVAALIEGERDARLAAKRLEEAARRAGVAMDPVIEFDPNDPPSIVPRARDADPKGLIVWGREETSLALIEAIRDAGIGAPILAPASLATPRVAARAERVGDLAVAAPYDLSAETPERAAFAKRYAERAGDPPPPIAVFAYDATRIAIEAVGRAGPNRARIRDAIADVRFGGLTGEIRFSGLGGNPAAPVLLALKEGAWRRIASPHPPSRSPGSSPPG